MTNAEVTLETVWPLRWFSDFPCKTHKLRRIIFACELVDDGQRTAAS